jgi:hypothetical protein
MTSVPIFTKQAVKAAACRECCGAIAAAKVARAPQRVVAKTKREAETSNYGTEAPEKKAGRGSVG